MQYPDDMPGEGAEPENCYGYLMQFADGNRLDLRLMTLEYAKKDILHDRLCVLLLDKDNMLPAIPDATDEDHWVKKPGKDPPHHQKHFRIFGQHISAIQIQSAIVGFHFIIRIA